MAASVIGGNRVLFCFFFLLWVLLEVRCGCWYALALISPPCEWGVIVFRTLIDHCCKTGVSVAGMGECILTAQFLLAQGFKINTGLLKTCKGTVVLVLSLAQRAGRRATAGWRWEAEAGGRTGQASKKCCEMMIREGA